MQAMTLHEEPLSREEFLEAVGKLKKQVVKRGKTSYYNWACAFDIETTSIYEGQDAIAGTMYVWQLGIHGMVTLGRTWQELKDLLADLRDLLYLSNEKRLVIYVHNLAFEFQALRHQFPITEMFAMSTRKPCRCLMMDCIELRCSYILSACALGDIKLNYFEVSKLSGEEFDYSKRRGCNTPLTAMEIAYCVHDDLVVMAYIWEVCKDEDKTIASIRMTKTGQVREFLRKSTIWNKYSKDRYARFMAQATITPDEYATLNRAFAGGHTHPSAPKVGKVYLADMEDIGSSYPTVLVSEKYPEAKGIKSERTDLTPEDILRMSSEDIGAAFDVEIWGLTAKVHCEHILSRSHCEELEDVWNDNGRVIGADHLKTTMLNIDFESFAKFYTWDKIKFTNVYIYNMHYLPKAFVWCVLYLYEMKTKLKGLPDEASKREYARSKAMLNSIFGDTVMDIVRLVFEYEDGEWQMPTYDIEGAIERYNNSKMRYNIYSTGVFCTAYARRNLYNAILGDYSYIGMERPAEAEGKSNQNAYIYADTDSYKGEADKMDHNWFTCYNEWITKRINTALDYHGLARSMAAPTDIKGKVHYLGQWDYEGRVYFKTLGAKRYITQDPESGVVECTIAGVGKKVGSAYLQAQADPFKAFKIGMIFPRENSGRLISHYIDEPVEGDFIDYLGEKQHYREETCICLVPSEYELCENTTYQLYLNLINNGGIYK